MTTGIDGVRAALVDMDAWLVLVCTRRARLAHFLRWAAACEANGRETSLRLENRDDIVRCRDVLPLFAEQWWAVVMYSCFDSTTGTRAVSERFRHPVGRAEAAAALAELHFPRRSVQHHRAQSTLAGARRSVLSACEKAQELRDVLFRRGISFDERFRLLMKVDVSWWGRTTCFDALLRAGALGVAGDTYRPENAYLRGSQGPAAGFESLWGIKVTADTAELCERVLHQWTATWFEVASEVGVRWGGAAYDSADFENALCVFQEPPRSGVPVAAAFELPQIAGT